MQVVAEWTDGAVLAGCYAITTLELETSRKGVKVPMICSEFLAFPPRFRVFLAQVRDPKTGSCWGPTRARICSFCRQQ